MPKRKTKEALKKMIPKLWLDFIAVATVGGFRSPGSWFVGRMIQMIEFDMFEKKVLAFGVMTHIGKDREFP